MKFLLLLFLFPFQLLAQKIEPLPKDLSGVWAGYMYNDTTGLTNDFEFAVSNTGGKLNGYTYTVFLIDGKKNIGIKTVKIKEKKDALLVEDDKLINDNYDAPPAKGVRTFIELHYSESDTSEILSGTWKTNITRQYNSVTGTVFLERKKQLEQTAIIQKLRQLNLSDQLSFLPKSAIASQNNSVVIAKLPVEVKKPSTSKQTIPGAAEKNHAGLAKKENKPLDKEKIIPDTTITNPEITIFMFPKNDLPAKENIKFEENKNVLAVTKDSYDLKRDSLLIVADRKEEKDDHPNTLVREKLIKDSQSKRETVAEIKPEGSGVENGVKTDLKNTGRNKEVAIVNPVSIKNDTKDINKLSDDNAEKSDKNFTVISPEKMNNSVPVAPAKKAAAEMLSSREITTIQTVEIYRDTLIFSLFDNGVIDGDTVSVLLNGKVIMSRIGLLAKAHNDTIYLTPEMGDSINIILYAENLGSIPPNTGLLVVRDGGIDHEIRFSGDLKKNSAIILKRKRFLNER